MVQKHPVYLIVSSLRYEHLNSLLKKGGLENELHLQMGVPLVQQVPEVGRHAPGHGLQLIQVHLSGLQPL